MVGVPSQNLNTEHASPILSSLEFLVWGNGGENDSIFLHQVAMRMRWGKFCRKFLRELMWRAEYGLHIARRQESRLPRFSCLKRQRCIYPLTLCPPRIGWRCCLLIFCPATGLPKRPLVDVWPASGAEGRSCLYQVFDNFQFLTTNAFSYSTGHSQSHDHTNV